MKTEYPYKKRDWETFDLLMTPSGFDAFSRKITASNKKKTQVYVHVCDEGVLNHKVLRIGKAKNGVIDRWINQSWGHGNTFLWSIGETKRYARYADQYPNYLAFFACLTGLKTKLHIRSCKPTESMNQIEKNMIRYFNPIWESYKKSVKRYFEQNPETKQSVAEYGGAKRAIISQRNGKPLFSPPIPDVLDFSDTTSRQWMTNSDLDKEVSDKNGLII
jgi:hypothetical protein